MEFEKLPQETVGDIVACFGRFIHDESVTPGILGKREFMRCALTNPDFLPRHLQAEIDLRRNGTSVAEYLLSHYQFSLEYSFYIPPELLG